MNISNKKNMLRIALHSRQGSFSDNWMIYCKENNINYKLVNCYEDNIVEQLEDCDALMWHFHHNNYKDVLFAKQLLFSLEQAGKIVFPNFNMVWHFDDKVGQKYLFEAKKNLHVPTYVFYSKSEALKWAKNTNYPKVFKLRSGAGSSNVRLVSNYSENEKLIRRAFSRGFSKFNSIHKLKENIRKYKENQDILLLLKGIGRLFIKPSDMTLMQQEKGYVYYQDFIPNNDFDIRVIVIDNKAFAIKRMVRDRDFRASGSGDIVYSRDCIDEKYISTAFSINKMLNTECLAYDFIRGENDEPLLVEISYGFSEKAYLDCPGYWDCNLKWHEEKINISGWIIESIISKIQNKMITI